jgi:hypothetical protein
MTGKALQSRKPCDTNNVAFRNLGQDHCRNTSMVKIQIEKNNVY